MDNITYVVTDSDGRYYNVHYNRGQWIGMDTLASPIDDSDIKWYTIRKLKQLMLREIESKWGGFEWIPID